MIDLSFSNNQTLKVGSILISDPFLDEDYFRRSVILVCEHNKEGSFGFVLNNFLDVDLHELDDSFPDIQARISLGGPVETQSLFFVHAFGEEIDESIPVNDVLSFGGNYTQIQALLKQNPEYKHRIRFFLGYSGWGKRQLSQELKGNSWLVVNNISSEEVLSTKHDDFWKYCLAKQGKQFKIMSGFPINPSNN